ncbi:MAG: aldehyde ferredoxin oxidoreductase family protein [Chloroflexi bacterium]|nr:aldehyde ferredoxin oxidoreductase family protein [Chloroflexota bacterium]
MEQTLGWTGKILRVDLSTAKINVEPTEAYAREMIGGRGIGQWVLFQELEPSVGALEPGNKVVLSTGPLTGTIAPASGRLNVDTKNPLTGGVASSSAGGRFGPELKFAGFDALIIEGVASQPVFLLIQDDKAELLDASPLWGKTTWETESWLQERMDDDRLRVASIGPAGENLVLGACLIIERGRAAGRGGTGAVLGSKRLKAIAVRGTQPIQVYDPDTLLEHVRRCLRKIEESSGAGLLRTGGTHYAYAAGGAYGTQPQTVRNYQDDYWPAERSAKIKEQVFKDNFERRRLACFNCPVYCGHFYGIKEGPYAGIRCEGIQANTIRVFGPNLDIDYPPALIKAQALCNQLGLDTDMAGVCLAWACELYERGIINIKDTGGLQLNWGDYQAALKLVEQLAYRQDFGKFLAQGVRQAAKTIGRGSERYAMHIKGADMNEGGMRISKSWALGIVTSTRGGGHLDGAPSTGFRRISPELGRALYGTAAAGNLTAYEGQAQVVFWFEKFKAVVDMLGICYFLTCWLDSDLIDPEDLALLFSATTGTNLSSGELLRLGQRLHNVEKAFNTLHAGFTRQDDFPPERLMREPTKSGPFAGEVLEHKKWEQMLEEYYTLQGWDLATSWQTEKCLQELGLEGVAERLAQYGKLVK